MEPSRITANPVGILNSPGPSPEVPNSRTKSPDASNTRTRIPSGAHHRVHAPHQPFRVAGGYPAAGETVDDVEFPARVEPDVAHAGRTFPTARRPAPRPGKTSWKSASSGWSRPGRSITSCAPSESAQGRVTRSNTRVVVVTDLVDIGRFLNWGGMRSERGLKG